MAAKGTEVSMNFFGALGQLARVLPGYVEGQRAAYDDNWKDLSNFNNVQQGQIGNAFLESVFPLEYQQVYDDTMQSNLRAINAGANTTKMLQSLPYELQVNLMRAKAAPYLLQQQVLQALNPGYNLATQLNTLSQFGINPQNAFNTGQTQDQFTALEQANAQIQALQEQIRRMRAGQQPSNAAWLDPPGQEDPRKAWFSEAGLV